jgi:hypothetical protein
MRFDKGDTPAFAIKTIANFHDFAFHHQLRETTSNLVIIGDIVKVFTHKDFAFAASNPVSDFVSIVLGVFIATLS